MTEKTSFENRIFKLSTGEKVSSVELEKMIGDKCHYIKYVAVGGDENENPVAMIFPNQKLLANPDYKLSPEDGCFCPRNLDELGRCLTGCLKLVNNQINHESSKLNSAAIINTEFQFNNESQTQSENVFSMYKNILRKTYGENVPAEEEIYFIKNTK